MWMMLSIFGALSFLAGVFICIFFIFKKSWTKARNIGLVAVGGFVLFAMGIVNYSDNEIMVDPVVANEQLPNEKIKKLY